ncbi:hypothetical protein [Brevundimonas aurantiaca]|jgi:hypothetical protein|uniref:hypothetical protein n=1 Tax=Brevundimonas aurantiaca TaxID=74316 RepID=UPI002FDE62E2
MTFPTGHPLDSVLATLGHMVRRGRAQALTPQDLSCTVIILDHALAESGADEDGLLRARLQMLWRAGQDETLTLDQFEAITGSIRRALQRARGVETPPPTAPLLPLGVSARRIGRFTVVEGGLNPSHNQTGH